jgi:hypothetical protein
MQIALATARGLREQLEHPLGRPLELREVG